MSTEAGCFLLGVVLSITTVALGVTIALGSGQVRCIDLGPKGEVLMCTAGHLNMPQVRS